MSDLVLRAEMNPRKVENAVAHTLKLPGKLGRIGYTRDPGEGDMFSTSLYQTNLRAIVRNPYGEIVETHELGSGKVTNVGVLTLSKSGKIPGVSGSPVNLFALLEWHGWGTGTTEAVTDIVLSAYAAPTVTEGVKGTNTVTSPGNGKPKFISTAKIKAESSLAITEWGIFNRKELKPAQETATAKSATTLTTTGTPYTESSTTVQGLVGYVVQVETTEAAGGEAWGVITSNTKSVLTVDAWYKKSDGTAATEPTATTKFRIIPTMFDHRKFEAINVVSGNEIEFPWELTLEAGG